jgi:hypothetical protein
VITHTRCDFCGRLFDALAWNERTCFRCEGSGAPNQSKLGWEDYQRLLADHLRELGIRAPLTKTAADKRAPAARTRSEAESDHRRRTDLRAAALRAKRAGA